MAWEYKREESQFEVLPEGQYRIRVRSAEKAQSKSGNDMLALQFDVSGSNTILYHYIVFLADRPEITNRMLTQFYDSFKDIPEGNTNLTAWLGQVGACKVKHDEYNGNKTAKISYFIKADKQGELPPWKEPTNNVRPSTNDGMDFTAVADGLHDEGLPFD
jgi:hypothetical protein